MQENRSAIQFTAVSFRLDELARPILRLGLLSPLMLGPSPFKITVKKQDERQVHVRIGKSGLEPNRPLQRVGRLGVSAFLGRKVAQGVEPVGVSPVQLHGKSGGTDRLGESPHRPQRQRQVIVRDRPRWICLDPLADDVDGFGKSVLIEQNVAEVVVCFGISGSQTNRLSARDHRFGESSQFPLRVAAVAVRRRRSAPTQSPD